MSFFTPEDLRNWILAASMFSTTSCQSLRPLITMRDGVSCFVNYIASWRADMIVSLKFYFPTVDAACNFHTNVHIKKQKSK